MNHADANKRILAAIPSMVPEGITAARTDWRKSNVLRQILNHEAERLIETARTELETCDPAETRKHQGEILGIRKTLAMINDQGHQ